MDDCKSDIEELFSFRVVDGSKITGERFLAAGGFGAVYKACHEDWGHVAVKKMFETITVSDRERTELVEEAKKMAESRHPNIVLLYGVIVEPGNYSLVVEFMQYGSMRKFQKSFDNPWPIRIKMVQDIILAMNYLDTTLNMVHKDLKIDNILVGEGFIAKVADFGLAIWRRYTRKYTKRKHSRSQPVAGTLSHIAPESLRDINRVPDSLFDVYSFAITLWEIITEEVPYDFAQTSAHICMAITNGQRPDMSKVRPECPEFLKTMVTDCWKGEPEDRPPFSVLKERMELEMKDIRDIVIQDAKIDLLEQIKRQYECEQKQTDGGKVVCQVESGSEAVSKVTKQLQKTTVTEDTVSQPMVVEDLEYGNESIAISHRDRNTEISEASTPFTDSQSPGVHPLKVTRKSQPFRTLDDQKDLPPGGRYTPTQGGIYYIVPGEQPIFLKTDSVNPENIGRGHSDTAKIINIGANTSSIHQLSGSDAMYMASKETPPSQALRKIKISTSDHCVSLEDCESISDHIGHAFRRLGRKLGFSDGQVDGVDHEHHSLKEKNFKLLRKWKECDGNKATRGALAEVLFDMKMYEVAELVPYD